VRALRVGVDQRLEELAGREPALLLQGLGAALEQELVRLAGAGRDLGAALGAAGGAERDGGEQEDGDGAEHSNHRVV
jgi:hypothetical protein